MQWIDSHAEAPARHPIPEVNYRSACSRYRVTATDISVAPEVREWIVWDMTTGQPTALMHGLKSHTVAMRAADGIAANRGLRIALRLTAVGRAIVATVRRLTA